MGKFNKKPSAADSSLTNEETSIDWSQLITHFQNQSVDQAMENIMAKVILSYNTFNLTYKNKLTIKLLRSQLKRILNLIRFV